MIGLFSLDCNFDKGKGAINYLSDALGHSFSEPDTYYVDISKELLLFLNADFNELSNSLNSSFQSLFCLKTSSDEAEEALSNIQKCLKEFQNFFQFNEPFYFLSLGIHYFLVNNYLSCVKEAKNHLISEDLLQQLESSFPVFCERKSNNTGRVSDKEIQEAIAEIRQYNSAKSNTSEKASSWLSIAIDSCDDDNINLADSIINSFKNLPFAKAFIDSHTDVNPSALSILEDIFMHQIQNELKTGYCNLIEHAYTSISPYMYSKMQYEELEYLQKLFCTEIADNLSITFKSHFDKFRHDIFAYLDIVVPGCQAHGATSEKYKKAYEELQKLYAPNLILPSNSNIKYIFHTIDEYIIIQLGFLYHHQLENKDFKLTKKTDSLKLKFCEKCCSIHNTVSKCLPKVSSRETNYVKMKTCYDNTKNSINKSMDITSQSGTNLRDIATNANNAKSKLDRTYTDCILNQTDPDVFISNATSILNDFDTFIKPHIATANKK